MRKKIGILGGTFDPPHVGHLIIANEVLNQLKLDEIHFMPNQEPPHKQLKSDTTSEQRVAMLKLAIQDHPAFFIETVELKRKGRSYSIDTLSILKRENPLHEYYFIIGADMVEYLPHWHKIDELLSLVTFVGVNRPHHHIETPYPIIEVKVPYIEISSTMIRDRIKGKQSFKYLTPDAVVDFIEGNGLYES